MTRVAFSSVRSATVSFSKMRRKWPCAVRSLVSSRTPIALLVIFDSWPGAIPKREQQAKLGAFVESAMPIPS
jgi:hypothetical protein